VSLVEDLRTSLPEDAAETWIVTGSSWSSLMTAEPDCASSAFVSGEAMVTE
jgi:hypothetical protein